MRGRGEIDYTTEGGAKVRILYHGYNYAGSWEEPPDAEVEIDEIHLEDGTAILAGVMTDEKYEEYLEAVYAEGAPLERVEI